MDNCFFIFYFYFFFLANFLILYYFNRKWFEIVEITYPANIDDWYAYTAVLPLIQKAHRNVCQLRKLRTGSPSIDILFRKSQKKKKKRNHKDYIKREQCCNQTLISIFNAFFHCCLLNAGRKKNPKNHVRVVCRKVLCRRLHLNSNKKLTAQMAEWPLKTIKP